LGRRRPYILFGALISAVAILLMPNSISIFMAAALLLVLDGSLNISMQPYRALVADVAPESQHTKCYSVQTALVGIGATLAYILPWALLHVFNLQEVSTPGTIPLSLKISFYIGAGVFLLANLWTVLFSKEYPPEQPVLKKIKQGNFLHRVWKGLENIVVSFIKMPKIMREVSVVQFFTWMGLFCIFLYFGIGVAQNIFGLPAGAPVDANPDYAKMLEQGIALGGVCFAIYNLVSIFYAMFLPRISKVITRKGAHFLSLVLGAVGLLACYFIHTTIPLFIAMIGLGAAWASIATIPYAMLASSLPENKMGLYMGLFNIMICVPEIIAALVLGAVVSKLFHNHAMSAILLAGIFLVIAAVCTLFIHDKKVEEIV
jgi:maltose/moltooligosaccharide transporter